MVRITPRLPWSASIRLNTWMSLLLPITPRWLTKDSIVREMLSSKRSASVSGGGTGSPLALALATAASCCCLYFAALCLRRPGIIVSIIFAMFPIQTRPYLSARRWNDSWRKCASTACSADSIFG